MANTKKTQVSPVETTEKVETARKVETPAKPIVAKDIDMTQYIPVRNGFHGLLIYVSSRTGEKFEWDHFGDEQEIELRELKNVKNSAKAFYENNWFMFDDDYKWVIDFLGLGKYYKGAVDVDHFDDLFELPADELKARLDVMSNGQKSTVMYRAMQLIQDSKIDSLKTIHVLEDALGVELIEK